MKKYKIRTDLTKVVDGVNLYRIEALIDFADVAKGKLGGYVQSEQNLSQCDNAWIYDDAVVCGRAKVFGNAKVCGDRLCRL